MSTWSELREKILSSIPIKGKTGNINEYDPFSTDLYEDDDGRLYTKHNLTDGIRIFTIINTSPLGGGSDIDISMIPVASFDAYKAYDKKQDSYINPSRTIPVRWKKWSGYISGRIRIPEEFIKWAKQFGDPEVDPLMYVSVAAAEGNFDPRNPGPKGYAYSGLFGQKYGKDKSIAQQFHDVDVTIYKQAIKGGLSVPEACAFAKMQNHMPAVARALLKRRLAGQQVWISGPPDAVAALLNSCYHMSNVTLAELIGTYFECQFIMKAIGNIRI